MSQSNLNPMNLQVNNSQVMTMWNAIASVMNADIPQGTDVGLLFETMTNLAESFQKGNTKHYLIQLTPDKVRAIWHSLNVCISNGFLPNQNMTLQALDCMAKLAKYIDDTGELQSPDENNKTMLDL